MIVALATQAATSYKLLQEQTQQLGFWPAAWRTASRVMPGQAVSPAEAG